MVFAKLLHSGYNTFTNVVLRLSFKQSVVNHSHFTMRAYSSFVAILVYVNDIILMGKNLATINSMKSKLQHAFKLKDLGHIRFFLIFEIDRNSKGISVNQRQYTLRLLNDAVCLSIAPPQLPMSSNKLLTTEGILLDDPQQYRCIVGRLLYLTHTRLNIMFVVHTVIQFVSVPGDSHLKAANPLTGYLKQQPGLGLLFDVDPSMKMSGFVDSNYTACVDFRRSILEFCIFLRSLINKPQSVVPLLKPNTDKWR